jgi:hypothetical protein
MAGRAPGADAWRSTFDQYALMSVPATPHEDDRFADRYRFEVPCSLAPVLLRSLAPDVRTKLRACGVEMTFVHNAPRACAHGAADDAASDATDRLLARAADFALAQGDLYADRDLQFWTEMVRADDRLVLVVHDGDAVYGLTVARPLRLTSQRLVLDVISLQAASKRLPARRDEATGAPVFLGDSMLTALLAVLSSQPGGGVLYAQAIDDASVNDGKAKTFWSIMPMSKCDAATMIMLQLSVGDAIHVQPGCVAIAKEVAFFPPFAGRALL